MYQSDIYKVSINQVESKNYFLGYLIRTSIGLNIVRVNRDADFGTLSGVLRKTITTCLSYHIREHYTKHFKTING